MMMLNVMGLSYLFETYSFFVLAFIIIAVVGAVIGIITLIIHLVNRHRMKKWLKNKDKKDKNREMNGFDTI